MFQPVLEDPREALLECWMIESGFVQSFQMNEILGSKRVQVHVEKILEGSYGDDDSKEVSYFGMKVGVGVGLDRFGCFAGEDEVDGFCEVLAGADERVAAHDAFGLITEWLSGLDGAFEIVPAKQDSDVPGDEGPRAVGKEDVGVDSDSADDFERDPGVC